MDKNKSNWHIMLFLALWAYRTSVKRATDFTSLHLVYSLEATFPIECEIPSLKLEIQLLPKTSALEERFVELEQLDETHKDATTANETYKRCVKVQYNKSICPRIFFEGDLVLVYD